MNTKNELAGNHSFKRVGQKTVQIKTAELLADGNHVLKTIKLKQVQCSDDFIKRTATRPSTGELDYSNGIIPFNQSPGAVDIGMNNVPVLDQGQEGTCVTFAATGALDAILGQGDFVSQQCSLELGSALGTDYWNGADYASEIIDPLKQYGLVSQTNCDNQYPVAEAQIDIPTYQSLADPKVTAANIDYTYVSGMSLALVKEALHLGHRVTIGFGLHVNQNDPISIQGFDTKVAGQPTTGGLWACKQNSSHSNYCGVPTDGHDVIVIGYDDAQQLLKIRNSWNTSVGDNGDFYMTYTFFEKMSGDGTKIFNTVS
jgi:C1A family cysteine protease